MKSSVKKKCLEPQHEGTEPLPLEDFYRHPENSDGRGPYCKTCAKRRYNAALQIRRAAKKEKEALGQGDSFLQRHEAKRRSEARISSMLEHQERVVVFDDSFPRQPTLKRRWGTW